MWQLAGKDAADRETWYKQMPAGLTRSGTRHPAQLRHQADLEAHMVEAKACSQAAWDVRTSHRMFACFAQLWGTRELWLNNAERPPLFNLKPPISDRHPGWGGGTYLHWDASLTDAPPLHSGLQIQGVLALADTAVNGGGIRVVPRFHRLLEEDAALAQEWRRRRADPSTPDNGPGGCMDLAEISGLPVVQLAANAGGERDRLHATFSLGSVSNTLAPCCTQT